MAYSGSILAAILPQRYEKEIIQRNNLVKIEKKSKEINRPYPHGVSLVASLIRVLLLSHFKDGAKNYWPNRSPKNEFRTQS